MKEPRFTSAFAVLIAFLALASCAKVSPGVMNAQAPSSSLSPRERSSDALNAEMTDQPFQTPTAAGTPEGPSDLGSRSTASAQPTGGTHAPKGDNEPLQDVCEETPEECKRQREEAAKNQPADQRDQRLDRRIRYGESFSQTLYPNTKAAFTLAPDGAFGMKFIYEESRRDTSNARTPEEWRNAPTVWINHFPEAKLLFVWEPEGATDKKDLRMCDLKLDPPEIENSPQTSMVAKSMVGANRREVNFAVGPGRLSIYTSFAYLHQATENGMQIVPADLAECREGLVPMTDEAHYEQFLYSPLVASVRLQPAAMNIKRYVRPQ